MKKEKKKKNDINEKRKEQFILWNGESLDIEGTYVVTLFGLEQ